MIPPHLHESKSTLRKHYLARRQTISEQDQALCALAIADYWSAHFATTGIIAGYYPARGEIDIMPLLSRLAHQNAITALPVITNNNKQLTFHAWHPGEPVTCGAYDMCEPLRDTPIVTPDILIVPLLAFDSRGHRLGYGGGYYDTTLKHLRKQSKVLVIGAAFSLQEHASLPTDPHDELLDFIITEREVIPTR